MTNSHETQPLSDSTIRPFTIAVSDEELDDLDRRLAATRWMDDLPEAGDDYGVSLARVRPLVEYWREQFDWRRTEARLNSYPQYSTMIDGQNVHFVHVVSPEPDAVPLLLTHGWPQTYIEYLDLVGPLTDPRAHGRDPRTAFSVVIPSLPGFGFSGPTSERGWGPTRIARAWAELMNRLGYDGYLAAGNDVGSIVSPEVGRVDPDHVAGVHVTQVFSFPSGDPQELEGMSEADSEKVRFLQHFRDNMGAYDRLQSSAPHTLAHALVDSPVGQLAWSAQLLGALPPEFVIANVAIYWFTRTAASSARFYYENRAEAKPTDPTTVPLGLANFAWDFQSIRPLAERDHRSIVQWNTYSTGSHFSTQDSADVLVDDLRGFAETVRRH